MVNKMSDSLKVNTPEYMYECKLCDFVCCYKSNYDTHLSTRKHKIMVTNGNLQQETDVASTTVTPASVIMCKYCNKQYAHLSALSRHKKTCSKIPINQAPTITRSEYDKLVGLIEKFTNNNESVKSNTDNSSYDENMKINVNVNVNDLQTTIDNNTKCMKEMMLMMITSNQLQHRMLEIAQQRNENIIVSTQSIPIPTSGTIALHSEHATIHNTTNSTTTTNSHNNNNTFNMNMFLNEKCKDAMNMKDFVNSIQLNMTDMENMDRLGYVEGMSTIFIDNLNKTDVYKRPVHCSDMKRDTLYVKENDQWEREGPDHAKMTKAVLAVEHKNVVLVNEWANANPRCLNSNTRENEKYFRLSNIVTDGDKEGNIAKVIRKVAKRVGIEKPAIASVEE